MINFGNILTFLAISIFMALLTTMILIASRLHQLKKSANRRLVNQDLYWDWFQIYNIPAAEPARSQFLVSIGANSAGSVSTVAAVSGETGGIALAALGLLMAVRWMIYPKVKKVALTALAEPDELSPAKIAEFIAVLR